VSLNIDGGSISLMGGRGTGSGQGGEVVFFTAPPSSERSPNEKNIPVIAGKFDDAQQAKDGTRFFLFDIQANLLKRVKLAPADTTGKKILYVEE
jgi:hypothetical protein